MLSFISDDAPSPRVYAALGLAVGLGFLSKFTFVVFLAGLALAALSVDRYRRVIRSPGLLVAALVATLLVLPFALWYVGQGHDLGRLYAREVRIEEQDAWAEQARTGLVYVARLAASYLAPVGLVLAVCFPTIYRRLPPGAGGSPGGRLLGWLLAWMLAILTLAALVGGLGFLKARWLIPAFFLVPLYGLWRVERHGVPEKRLAVFAVILVLAEVAVVGTLSVRVVGASLFRRPYRMSEPYDDVATGLSRAGFTRGTIVAGFGTLAGNLAVRFPDARVLHTEYLDFRPPPGSAGQCLIVWDRHRRWRGGAGGPRTARGRPAPRRRAGGGAHGLGAGRRGRGALPVRPSPGPAGVLHPLPRGGGPVPLTPEPARLRAQPSSETINAMRIGNVEVRGLARLAPMAGATNAPFRLVARECGSGLTTTEEMDAASILYETPHAISATAYYPAERPLAMQLLGKNAEALAEAAARCEALGADVVDLNMGCPVQRITGKGKGAALMRDMPATARILRAMRAAIRVPLTVKIRGGWDDTHLNAVEVAQMAEAEGVDAITVHPRTRSQHVHGQGAVDDHRRGRRRGSHPGDRQRGRPLDGGRAPHDGGDRMPVGHGRPRRPRAALGVRRGATTRCRRRPARVPGAGHRPPRRPDQGALRRAVRAGPDQEAPVLVHRWARPRARVPGRDLPGQTPTRCGRSSSATRRGRSAGTQAALLETATA